MWSWVVGCAHVVEPEVPTPERPPVDLDDSDVERLTSAIEDLDLDVDCGGGEPTATHDLALGHDDVLRVWPGAGPMVERKAVGFVTASWSSVSRLLIVRTGPDADSEGASTVDYYYQPLRWEIVAAAGRTFTPVQ